MSRRSKNAQIKMFETVGVLIIFFFLLITGSVFYFGAQKSALQKEKVESSEKYAFQIVLKSLYLPELDCSFLVTQKDNCIDKIKLQKLSTLLSQEQAQIDYFTDFGYSTITVEEIYPTKTKITLYNNQPDQYEGKLAYQSPILLFDALRDEYNFGVIEVTVYV